MIQVREVLRRWLRREGGERVIAECARVDRKRARRYVEPAQQLGLERDGDESQLTDELIGKVCELMRPARPNGQGDS